MAGAGQPTPESSAAGAGQPTSTARRGPRPDLLRRQQALAKTLRKYRGKPMVLGKADCVLMARSHLVAMGHRGLPPAPKYSSATGALRALKAMADGTVAGLLDAHLPRIAPAAMLPGDLALVESEDGLGGGTVVIAVGGKMLGWHPDATGMVVIEPTQAHPFVAAWRA